jgi:subtilisin family serine protease
LPFVTRVQPVAEGANEQSALPDLQDPGPSFLQIDMLHIPEVHAMGDHGEGVLICVLDSGFQLDHQSFRQLEVRGQRDFVNGDGDPSYDPRTDIPTEPNHGTAVLSVLAGYVPGVLIGPAYRAEYLLGKTEEVGSELPVEEDYWIAGVEWAEAEGADILTSSLTYHLWYRARDLDGRTSPATRAANLALERGLLIVNASGNEGVKGIGAPADAPGAVTVGAVNGIGALTGFSSVGPTYDGRVKPDVVALGSQVYAALARTWDRYTRISGTSFSAPLVAGCAALVLSRHPDWGPETVREALAMSANRADRPDNQYGWGIVNARDAVLYPLLEGTVSDSITREPIPGATVRWSATAKSGAVETDSTGAYVIPNLDRGTYSITVSKPGYEDATAGPYDLPPNLGDANVALKPK